ncbi:nitrile hydratase accessory protein [Sneathiella marina]|uniref:Nitrile hydratase accessory protein n=1 Tax=Sneathiella marina TaxID=2950108 RepID=A0ABY4W6S2_9PROT|nr:nitrile hydratase accessory protein [Sneathiella marina]USG60994.1 nitrile hydratase accessory protein [Sneathiella marina]
MNTSDLHPGIREQAEAAIPAKPEGEPLFRLAWHGRIFALVVAMVNRDQISWKSFQQRLVHGLAQQQNADLQLSMEEIDLQYFDCWLAAAEEILREDGFLEAHELRVQMDGIRSTVAEIREGQLDRNSEN